MERVVLRPGQRVVIESPLPSMDERFFGGDPRLVRPIDPNVRSALVHFRDTVANNVSHIMQGLGEVEDRDRLDQVIDPVMVRDIKNGHLEEAQAVEVGSRALVKAGLEDRDLAANAVRNLFGKAEYSAGLR